MVRPVLHLDDYTDQEYSDCWYECDDKKRRKDEIRDTIRLVRDGNFNECTRGLEKLLDGTKYRKRRRMSIQDVLDEQETQRKEAKATKCEDIVYDAMKFRMAYRPHSRAARHIAHAMGKIDEMAIACQRTSVPDTRESKPNNEVIASVHSNNFGIFLQLDFSQ